MIEQYGGDEKDDIKKINSELRPAKVQIMGSTDLLRKIRERVAIVREDSPMDIYKDFFGPASVEEGDKTVSTQIDCT
jgi:hypothetical protein